MISIHWWDMCLWILSFQHYKCYELIKQKNAIHYYDYSYYFNKKKMITSIITDPLDDRNDKQKFVFHANE